MVKAYKERSDKGVRRSAYVEVTCPCGKVFEVRKSLHDKGRGKRCSKECQNRYATRPSDLTYEKHKENPTSFKPGNKPWNEGVPTVPWNKGLQSSDPLSWRRTSVEGYDALHHQLYRERGSAVHHTCSHADETCKGAIQWANISQEYKGVEDFMPLCVSHHLRYDRGK